MRRYLTNDRSQTLFEGTVERWPAREPCPSPGCPQQLQVDEETRVLRCPMHGPMRPLDES